MVILVVGEMVDELNVSNIECVVLDEIMNRLIVYNIFLFITKDLVKRRDGNRAD
jgi:hypothetical protein